MDRRGFLQMLGAMSAAFGVDFAAGQPLGPRSVPGPRGGDFAARPASARRKHWAWERGTYRSIDEWRSLLATMRAAGIEAVLAGGTEEFYREYAPAAKAEGLEVHAWIPTLMRGEHVKAHPDWYAVSRAGVSAAVKPPYVNYYRFMCPSRDEVRQYLLDYVGELARIDGLAGVHFDYIRYPDVILPVALWPKYKVVQDKEYPEFDFCYCSTCRERFKARAGRDPLELADPPADEAWRRYRWDSITGVVNLLADEVRRRGKQATAAVFPTPAIARALVRQEWPSWRIDAVMPMAYHAFYKEDVGWIERATREGVEALKGRIPLYTGLYLPDLPPADLARAGRHALAGGASGICLFQGNSLTAEHWAAIKPVLEAR